MKLFQIPEGMARPLALLIAINILAPLVVYEIHNGFFAIWGEGLDQDTLAKAGRWAGYALVMVLFILQFLNMRVARGYQGLSSWVHILILANVLSFPFGGNLSVFFWIFSWMLKGAIIFFL